MKEFFSHNGIKHITSAPYHPASNGLAERAVQTFKSALKRLKVGSLETQIQRFLFDCRITPHSTTGISPANLLMNRQPKSKLDLVLPNLSKRITDVQNKQKHQHDQHAKCQSFNPGDKVLARNDYDMKCGSLHRELKLLVQFHTQFVLIKIVEYFEGTKIS